MKDLFLSASSIRDYIDCSKRYYYRRFKKDDGIDTPSMRFGSAMHFLLEEHWNAPYDILLKKLKHLLEDSEIANKYYLSKGREQIVQFCANFQHLLAKDDTIELSFKIPYSPGIYIVGKIDRILGGNTVVDWKTSGNPSAKLDMDVQFILYNWAYKKLYGKNPAGVFLGSLSSGKMLPYAHNEENEYILMQEVIPNMVRAIDNADYVPVGRLISGKCYNCIFKDVCDDELDSRNSSS